MGSFFNRNGKIKKPLDRFKVVFTFKGFCDETKTNCKTDEVDLTPIRTARTWLFAKVNGNFIFAEGCYYDGQGNLTLVLGPYDTVEEAELVRNGIQNSLCNGGVVETDIQTA